jgi:YD repeat-containing protein
VDYSGTSVSYTKGQSGTYTLYIFPGGTNSSLYTPPPPDSPDIDDDSELPPDDEDPGCGMPIWQVSQPFISLWLKDEPLGYQPAVGSRISFKLSFKQREASSGFNPNIFSVGKRWSCSWLSHIGPSTSGKIQVYSGVRFFQRTKNGIIYGILFQPTRGGSIFYPDNVGSGTSNSSTNYLTNSRLTGNTANGYSVTNSDGSTDVYGLVVTNTDGSYVSSFLTQHINERGQKTTLNYASYVPSASPVIRLKSVVDGDGRTNLIYYVASNPYSTNLISQVTDPFGRSTYLSYNDNGDLTNITDVAGNSSSISYDGNDWVTSLTTPYGSTSFAITDGTNSTVPNGRSITVTKPDGGHEMFLYKDFAPGVASSYSPIPDTTPFGNSFCNSHLDMRNSFHWGPRQYAALSTTTVSALTSADFQKAQMKHWLLRVGGNTLGEAVSLQREPSPDSAGTIEGQKTWFDHAGKITSEYEGTQIEPLFTAWILPNGATYFVREERNPIGGVVKSVSTFSGGLRTNLFVYADNNLDLIAVTNALGVQVSSNR